MASTAAYNLSDNHRYSIANFNFNLTFAASANLRVINVFIIIIINTLQQLYYSYAQADEILPKINALKQYYVRKQ